MLKKKKVDIRRRLLIFSAFIVLAITVLFFQALISVMTEDNGETITFKSADGLLITADLYLKHDTSTAPLVLMFHQDNWSRGEYTEIAPQFNELGYNCIAVDLRAGSEVLGVTNETAELAQESGKPHSPVDALLDVKAAINYAISTYEPPLLLALGSSYSSGLILRVAGDSPTLLDGIIAFSPGEYFAQEGMPYDWIEQAASQITIPVFFASARNEKYAWEKIFKSINTSSKISYTSISNGHHGARSLWKRYQDSEEHWRVMETFLKSFF